VLSWLSRGVGLRRPGQGWGRVCGQRPLSVLWANNLRQSSDGTESSAAMRSPEPGTASIILDSPRPVWSKQDSSSLTGLGGRTIFDQRPGPPRPPSQPAEQPQPQQNVRGTR
jgi:hypothetical protein